MSKKELINQLDSQGKQHGLWVAYRPDGTLCWKVNWHHGLHHGKFESTINGRILRLNFCYGVQKGCQIYSDSESVVQSKRYVLILK
jgi:hypothetical protein